MANHATKHPKDPAHPDFPHGERIGYKLGCRKSAYTCPATPSCNDKHSASMRDRRQRSAKSKHVTEGRLASYVHHRLTETLEKVTVEQLAERTGLPAATIASFAADHGALGIRLPETIAAPLDEAWAWYVHGSDVTRLDNHGTDRAYLRHMCRCAPCTAQAGRTRKLSGAGLNKGPRSYVRDPDLPQLVRDLYAITGSWKQLCNLTGLQEIGLKNIAGGVTHVRKTTSDRLRALTIAQIEAARPPLSYVPGERAWHIAGTLNALGYPTCWINRQIGRDQARAYHRDRPISARALRALEGLAARIGDRPATTEDGISAHSLSRVRNLARQRGFYPPAFYDNGVLDYRSIENHPWAKSDSKCAEIMAALYLRATTDLPLHAIAAQAGRHGNNSARSKWVERRSFDAGLWSASPGVTELHPACRARARAIRDVWHQFDMGAIGAVTAMLMLDIPFGVRHDHPEVIAYRADHPELVIPESTDSEETVDQAA